MDYRVKPGNDEKTGEVLSLFLNAGTQDGLMKTKNAYTLLTRKPKLQFITRWVYEHPRDVIGDLDFTVCCAVIWYDTTDKKFKSACHDLYYEDLSARRLRYTSPSRIEEVGGSALRILKYYNKGYKITLESYGRVIARLVSGWNDFEGEDGKLLNQLDPSYEEFNAAVFAGLMKEVDPGSVTERDVHELRDVEAEAHEAAKEINVPEIK